MFQGESDHTLDDKNRLIIPTKIRSLLGSRFFVTRGYGAACLWVFTEVEWNSFVEALDRLPQLDSQTKLLKRYFTSAECSPDTQGRISIPPKLRAYAKIEDHGAVVIVGTGNKLEIWSAAEWEKYNDSITFDMIENAAKGIGI